MSLQKLIDFRAEQRKEPIKKLNALYDRLQTTGQEGIVAQYEAARKTENLLENLQNQQKDWGKQQIYESLMKLGDSFLGPNNPISLTPASNALKQPDRTNDIASLQQLLGQQNKGITDSEMDLINNQIKTQAEQLKGLNAGIGGLGNMLRPMTPLQQRQMDYLDAKIDKTKEDKKKKEQERDLKLRDVITSLTGGQKASATALDDVHRAIEIIEKNPYIASGTLGTASSKIAGFYKELPYNRLENMLESIASNIGIDQLIKIKKSGAGLGHVPQSQLKTLQSLLGLVKPNMSKTDLLYNLNRIKKQYTEIIENIEKEKYEIENGIPVKDIDNPTTILDHSTGLDAYSKSLNEGSKTPSILNRSSEKQNKATKENKEDSSNLFKDKELEEFENSLEF